MARGEDPQTQTELTSNAAVPGTVGYMSPEQMRGDPLDARSDLFQVGIVLYECLSGTAAFGGKSPLERFAATTLLEVRPRTTPKVKVWEELTDRSLTFMKATMPAARGKRYCQVALADASGEKSKDVVRADERSQLPRWFDQLAHRLRAKEAVRSTKGTDGRLLVALVPADDHELMIRCFFAMKVWVLKEGFQLKGSA